MKTVISTLETQRLFLKPLEIADADAIQKVFPQWEIVKFLNATIPWPYPAGAARRHLNEIALPAIERGEEWQWSIRLKTDPAQLIGIMHLKDDEGDNRGFWLTPKWQGQGLMTEACEAATDYWFNVLHKPILRAPKAVMNIPSRRISERSGMRLVQVEERDYIAGRLKAEIWEISAAEWQTRSRTANRPKTSSAAPEV